MPKACVPAGSPAGFRGPLGAAPGLRRRARSGPAAAARPAVPRAGYVGLTLLAVMPGARRFLWSGERGWGG